MSSLTIPRTRDWAASSDCSVTMRPSLSAAPGLPKSWAPAAPKSARRGTAARPGRANHRTSFHRISTGVGPRFSTSRNPGPMLSGHSSPRGSIITFASDRPMLRPCNPQPRVSRRGQCSSPSSKPPVAGEAGNPGSQTDRSESTALSFCARLAPPETPCRFRSLPDRRRRSGRAGHRLASRSPLAQRCSAGRPEVLRNFD